MGQSRYAFVNPLQGATITASSETTDRPATYLASPYRWKKWRSATDVVDQWVKFDLGSAQSLQAFLLADWTAHAGGKIWAQANATDAWGAPTVNELFTLPASNVTRVIGVWLPAAQSLRWVRFLFENTGAANAYVDLGVAFAGAYFEPSVNLTDDFSLTRTDPSVITATPDGQESAVEYGKFFDVAAVYEDVAAADKASFLDLFDTVGVSRALFFAVDPDDADLTFYGRFLRIPDLQHRLLLTQWDLKIDFREVR